MCFFQAANDVDRKTALKYKEIKMPHRKSIASGGCQYMRRKEKAMGRYLILLGIFVFVLGWPGAGFADSIHDVTLDDKIIVPPSSAQEQKGVDVPKSKVVQENARAKSIDKAPKVAGEKIKVIGNSDSKRYHLPGMKYYHAVEAYHRVEFDSEAEAVKAGYHKAPK